eukprot:scaffold17853_cov15-Prasinocladus_malaysianus.AAC.1
MEVFNKPPVMWSWYIVTLWMKSRWNAVASLKSSVSARDSEPSEMNIRLTSHHAPPTSRHTKRLPGMQLAERRTCCLAEL